MTKTYNDIEAVTRLLEEKERDLELAARIGQTLLEKNKSLEDKNEQLEELVGQANEKINQIRHELSMKDELLHIYTQNLEGSDLSSPESATPTSPNNPFLQKKIKTLEEENLELHLETAKLKSATDTLEEKEQKLVNDCVQQLEDVHNQLDQFAKELSEKTEECSRQKEEVTNLLHQIVQLQKKIRCLTVENLDYQKTIEAAQDTENYLTREIAELKEKNEELLVLLEEVQDEVRQLRKKERPGAMRHSFMSSMLSLPGESLASELENSLRSELDYPRGYSPRDRKRHNWKIFETARAARAAGAHQDKASSLAGDSDMSMNTSLLGTGELESLDRSVSQRSSMYFSDGESGIVEEQAASDLDSLYSGPRRVGRPGIPGSNDLQTALKRLSLRRANELNEMDFAREERERQKNRERRLSEMTDMSDMELSQTGRHSPDSTISGNSGYLSMTGSNTSHMFRMPEKLRIVKPLEGSVTLRQWQQLATPHLGRIFESQPGVQIKGEKKLDMGPEEEYTLSDYEEDDDLTDYPTRFQETCSLYTYTNSTVKHPSEADRMSSSYPSSTPRLAVPKIRDNHGTSTYSMSLGLAAILNERDLLKTPPEGAPVAVHPPSISSNPTRFPSLVSDSIYEPPKCRPVSAALTTPTRSCSVISSPNVWSGKPNGPISQASTTKTSTPVSSGNTDSDYASPKTSVVNNPISDTSPINVIDKLKMSGYSLYGYLKGSATDKKEMSETGVTLSRPNNLNLTSTSVTGATVGPRSSASQVTLGGQPEGSSRTHLTSLLTRTAPGAGGVIGALAKFHRDGTF